jgi:hypothetical protein
MELLFTFLMEIWSFAPFFQGFFSLPVMSIMLHFQFEITFDISTMKWTFGKVIFKIEGFQAIFNNIFRGKIAGIFCWILENWFKYLECGIVVIGKFKCQTPRENLLVWTFRLYNSIRVLIRKRKKKSEAFFHLDSLNKKRNSLKIFRKIEKAF